MNIWTKRLFILLSIGGGFFGVVSTSYHLPPAQYRVVNQEFFLTLAMIAVFLFGVFSGLTFIEDETKGLRMLLWYFGIQIFACSSSILTYQVISGAELTVVWTFERGMEVFKQIGSKAGVSFFADAPWGFGVNIFALVTFLRTTHILKKTEKRANKSPQTTTGSSAPSLV